MTACMLLNFSRRRNEGGVEENNQAMSNCQHLYFVNSSLILCLAFPSKLPMTKKKYEPGQIGEQRSVTHPGSGSTCVDSWCVTSWNVPSWCGKNSMHPLTLIIVPFDRVGNDPVNPRAITEALSSESLYWKMKYFVYSPHQALNYTPSGKRLLGLVTNQGNWLLGKMNKWRQGKK